MFSRWTLSVLSDYLREQRLLLVIDSCERLLNDRGVLAYILTESDLLARAEFKA